MAVHERRYQHESVNREQTFVKLFREDRGNGAVRIGKHLEKRRGKQSVCTSLHSSGGRYDLQAGGDIGALVRDGGHRVCAPAARGELVQCGEEEFAACAYPTRSLPVHW